MTALSFDQITNLAILRQFYFLAWRLIGVNIALVSPDLKRSLAFGETERWSPFCIKLRQMAGAQHCLACDRQHLSEVGEEKESVRYQCWVGLREFIAPIMLDGDILAFIQCGQCLDDAPTEKDWQAAEKTLMKAGVDPASLKELFLAVRVIPAEKQQDLMALLELFGNYIANSQYQILMAEASSQSQVEENALSYIRAHYNEPLSLDDISQAAATSKRNLSRIFREKLGVTVLDVIQEMRINAACKLLQAGDVTSMKVALECGFGSVQQFNRVFKKLKQCTPQAWLQAHARKH